MHHPMRAAKMTDEIATKIRVKGFEILKQKSNSPMRKITILSSRTDFMNQAQHQERKEMTYDHISRAQGRLKLIAVPLKTEVPVTILIDILYVDCQSVTRAHTSDAAVHSLRQQGLLYPWYDCDELGAGQS